MVMTQNTFSMKKILSEGKYTQFLNTYDPSTRKLVLFTFKGVSYQFVIHVFFVRNWFVRNSYYDGKGFKKLFECLRGIKKLLKVKCKNIVENMPLSLLISIDLPLISMKISMLN